MWNSWLFKIFNAFVCQKWNYHAFRFPDVETTFCSAVINNIENITVKTINSTRAQFFGKFIFKTKLVDNLAANLKMLFTLQYGYVFTIEYSEHRFISNNFLPGYGKTKTNPFSVTAQIITFQIIKFFDSS